MVEELPNNPNSVSYLEQLDALEIPQHVDAALLALWRERELAEWERQNRQTRPVRRPATRGLTRLFASFLGISAMCLVIVLGLIHGRDSAEILRTACQSFLFYAIFGCFIGWIAEKCVQDSIETLLREILRRGADQIPQQLPTDEVPGID